MSKLVLRNIGKSFGDFQAVNDFSLELSQGRVRVAARAVGLRQDHDAAHDRGLHAAQRRHDRDGRPGDLVGRRRGAAREAAHVDDLPELRHLAEHDGRRECRLRPAGAQAAARRDRAPRRPDPRRRAAGRAQAAAIRPSCRAASSSAWRWPAPSSSSRRCCCSTSRCPISTPTCARRCASRSAACTTSSGSRRSTSRTTSPRRW